MTDAAPALMWSNDKGIQMQDVLIFWDTNVPGEVCITRNGIITGNYDVTGRARICEEWCRRPIRRNDFSFR